MSKYTDYYKYDESEDRYLRFLEAPGDGLGMVLGDAPTVEDILARGGTVFIKSKKSEPIQPKLVIVDHKKKCQKCGGRDWVDLMKDGIGDCCHKHVSKSKSDDKRMAAQSLKEERQAIRDYGHRSAKASSRLKAKFKHARGEEREHAKMFAEELDKALPKTDKSAAPARKAKSSKAGKQVAGKTGKVRSSYPQETSGQPPSAPQPQEQQPPPKANPAKVPQETEEGPPVASPAELANILHMPVTSLQRIAHRFRDNKKLGGRSGFVTFMKTRLKEMSSKHQLDGDYFGLIFDALCPKKPTQLVKAHREYTRTLKTGKIIHVAAAGVTATAHRMQDVAAHSELTQKLRKLTRNAGGNDSMDTLLENPKHAHAVLLHHGKQLVGWATVKGDKRSSHMNVFVDKKHRRKGHGTTLVEAVRKVVAKQHLPPLSAQSSDSGGLKFYLKTGVLHA